MLQTQKLLRESVSSHGLDICERRTVKEQWLCLEQLLLKAEFPSCQYKSLSIPNKYYLKKKKGKFTSKILK